MVETLDASRLSRNADVVKSSYSQATILPNINKVLLFPPHENVGMRRESITPEFTQGMLNLLTSNLSGV